MGARYFDKPIKASGFSLKREIQGFPAEAVLIAQGIP